MWNIPYSEDLNKTHDCAEGRFLNATNKQKSALLFFSRSAVLTEWSTEMNFSFNFALFHNITVQGNVTIFLHHNCFP